jgi:hypothetical protein
VLITSHCFSGVTGGRDRNFLALLVCSAAAVAALRIALAAAFSLVAAVAVSASIAICADWISVAHLSFAADSTALLELSCCMRDAIRQSLSANPPLKARATRTAITIAVIAGVLIIYVPIKNPARAGTNKKPAQGGQIGENHTRRFLYWTKKYPHKRVWELHKKPACEGGQ